MELNGEEFEDDEFFGSQEECESHTDVQVSRSFQRNEFGDMGEHEVDAKRRELEKVGFLDAYDEYKEARLQEGFERGFLDSFENGKRLGKIIGNITTLERLHANESKPNVNGEIDFSDTDMLRAREMERVIEMVHKYFTTQFQANAKSRNGKKELESVIARAESHLDRCNRC